MAVWMVYEMDGQMVESLDDKMVGSSAVSVVMMAVLMAGQKVVKMV